MSNNLIEQSYGTGLIYSDEQLCANSRYLKKQIFIIYC